MIIYRYLIKELYKSLLVVTLIVIVIFATNQFVHFLREAALGRLTDLAVFKIMSLEVPMLFAYLLPLGFYISILLVIGGMYLNNEITVLQACGVSQWRLFMMVLSLATLLAAVVFWLMFYIDPVVEGTQQYVTAKAMQELTIKKIIPGKFKELGEGEVFYSRGASSNRETLQQVFMAQAKTVLVGKLKKTRWDITVAAAVDQQWLAGITMPFIVFYDGYRFRGIAGQHKLSLSKYTKYAMKIPQPTNKIDVWPQNATLVQLLAARKHDRHAAAVFHWRLALPISVFILTIMAFPLAPVNPRKGKLSKFFPAIMLYVVYVNFLFIGRSWIDSGKYSNAWGLWWVHAAALLVGLTLCCIHFKWWRPLMRKVRR